MRKNVQKRLALMLIMCMVATLLPATAWADSSVDYTVNTSDVNDGRVQSLSLAVNGSTLTATMNLKDALPDSFVINQDDFQGLYLWKWGVTFSDGKSLYELNTYRETYKKGSEQSISRSDAFGSDTDAFYSAIWKDYRYNRGDDEVDGGFVLFFREDGDITFDVELSNDYKTITWTVDLDGINDIDLDSIEYIGYRLTDPTQYNTSGSDKLAENYTAGYHDSGSGFVSLGDDLDLDNAIGAAPYQVTYSELRSTGGAVPMDPSSYASGVTVTVLGNPGNLKRAGYSFGGWTIRPVDEGDSDYDKPPLTTFKILTDITLYPLWISGGTQEDDFTVEISGGPFTYSGLALNPTITVRTSGDTPTALVKNTDYTVTFKKNGNDVSEVKNAGTYTAVVTGIGSYAGSSAEETFTVAKAVPASGSYTLPSGINAVYGQTLSEVILGAGFSWEAPGATTVGNVGTNTFTVKYTPADSENYEDVTGITANIVVSKANQTTPVLTLSSANALVGVTAPTLNVTGGNGTGAWNYASSNDGVASVDSATGIIVVHSAGTVSFTVSKAGDSNYNASGISATAALTVKDRVEVTARDTVATAAAIVEHLKNQGKISVGIPARAGLTNQYTLAVNGNSDLTAYASSDASQGEANWIGLLIGNLRVNGGTAFQMTDLYYKTSEEGAYGRLTSTDENESVQVGGNEKELVLWIKSNVDPTKVIWLATSSDGANEVKLTVTFTPYKKSSHSGGGSGGGGSVVSPTAPSTPVVSEKVTTVISANVTGQTDAQGVASATVSSGTLSELIEKAKAAEAKENAAVIKINVATDSNAKAAEISIEKAAFESIVKETKAEVKVETGIGSITFDEIALETINKEAGQNVSIRIETIDAQSLADDLKGIVGDRPVYDFTVSSGDTKISSFNGGSAEVSVPYSLKPGEDKNAVVVYYVDDSGKLQSINGAFNEKTGTVEFKVSHFSRYAIGYNKISFNDVSGSAWYHDAVTFLAARGITSGSAKDQFSPDAAITRGEFIVMLMRAYGVEPKTNASENFADAGNAYYSGYLAAAKQLEITKGTGNNLYQPGVKISRQDMFTLLYRALEVIGEVPDGGAQNAVQFSDSSELAAYAESSVEALVRSGIVSGSNGQLNPKGVSTRAQMAQTLYNLLAK